MRGFYSSNFRINNLAAARTLFYITAASTHVIRIIDIKVTNEDNETNEQLACIWQKITTLGTPTATTVTPRKMENGDAAAAGTYKASVTASEPTYGAVAQDAGIADAHCLAGFPSLSGYDPQIIPETTPFIAPSESWGLRLLNAPAVAVDVNVNVVTQEIG